MSCQHENFQANADIGRITGEQDGDVVAFVMDIKVRCVECGQSFGFRGMPPGLAWDVPTRSPDALEAHLPLLSPSELAMNGPLPGLVDDPPPPPMSSYRIQTR